MENQEKEIPLQLLTEDEAAKLLNVKKNTINNWRFNSTGPKYYRLCGVIRYSQSDLLDFLQKSLQSPAPKSSTRD